MSPRGHKWLAGGLVRDEKGQALAEYGMLMWFLTLMGAVCLVVFFFGFEEGVIAYYEDIVNMVCLPIP